MERWVMNRLGFVNFWVYDVEDFYLNDGKLLLRGSNGSGKSITTQSFIPYILDGDRQPSRLDPFGSKDRKMDFYLLGDSENGKDECTGYLYLEFKKPSSNLFRTIGIGLHAKKGGNMKTWGFCVRDNRRVGFDFMLYREVGSENIPLNSKQLREQIGDKNIYVEKTSDYKAMVAKQIFDIDRENIEDFDQLTSILIKTRSSKLSSKENLKPAQLYELLNSSLQTLSDEELRPMADSMNKIEESHRRVEDAQSVLQEVQYIANEYDKYNKYMLWKKADVFLNKRANTACADNKMQEYKDEISQSTQELERAISNINSAETMLSDLTREEQTLDDNDIKNQVAKKANAQKNLKENEDSYANKQKFIDSKKETSRKKHIELNSVRTQKTEYEYDIKKQTAKLLEYDEFAPPLHESYIRELEKNDKAFEKNRQCSREINDYISKLTSVLQAINECDRIHGVFDLAHQRRDLAEQNKFTAEDSLKTAQKIFDEQKDTLIESFYIAAKNNTEFTIDKYLLEKIETLIANYEGDGSAVDLLNLLVNRKGSFESKIQVNIASCNTECQASKNDYEISVKELEDLKNTKELEPERSDIRKSSRKALCEKGIVSRPLYECIDFKNGLDESQKAVLESEFSDMGLLDALVVSKSQYDMTIEQLKDFSDCVLYAKSVDNSENPFFDVIIDDELREDAILIINAICSSDEFSAKIGLNGYYQNGMLVGHAISENNARYIGAESRRKYREKQISELEYKTNQLNEIWINKKETLEKTKNRLALLNDEYNTLANTESLSSAMNLWQEAQNELTKKQMIFDNAETDLEKNKLEYDASRSNVDTLSSGISYRKTADNYKNAISEISEYLNDLQDVLEISRQKFESASTINRLDDDIELLDYDIDLADLELKKIEREIHNNEEVIRLCDDFLNRPENVNIAKRASEIKGEIENSRKNIDDYKQIKVRCETKIENSNNQLEQAKNQLAKLIDEEEIAAKYFKEECELWLVITDRNLTLLQCAEYAQKSVASADMEKGPNTIQSRLAKIFHEHTGTFAAEYNPVMNDDCFEDSGSNNIRRRSMVLLTWQNKKISPLEFVEEISRAIEDDKLLMRIEEQKMFTEVLMNTISKKLYDKINTSRRWVDSMADLMKKINTSMGLSFSLSWNAKKELGDSQLQFKDLARILSKDKDLISPDDYDKLSAHFKGKIEYEKRLIEEKGEDVNYSKLVRNVLDFRNWFEFCLYYKDANMDKFRELTNSRFNTFSGGERALSLYIPLFAAVAAQYKKAGEQAPKILALDEAFAGVDDENISEMFGLLEKLGFGYIVNSQSLWGCYDTVPALSIAELCHAKNTDFITVIHYEWNGKVKKLIE